jgi:hypothetical protein
MRIVAIMAVLAIVYLLYGRNGEEQRPQARIAEAQREAAKVGPAQGAGDRAPVTGSLRGAIDNTRQTLDLVKKRNNE